MMFLIFFHPYTLTPMGLALSSTLVNIILASLISFRLVRQQRHIRKVLGAEHGSPYSKIITICVESSALIVIFNAIYIVLGYMQSTGSVFIPLLLLPHICVGGLDFFDLLCTSKIFFTGYLTPPHCLPRC